MIDSISRNLVYSSKGHVPIFWTYGLSSIHIMGIFMISCAKIVGFYFVLRGWGLGWLYFKAFMLLVNDKAPNF